MSEQEWISVEERTLVQGYEYWLYNGRYVYQSELRGEFFFGRDIDEGEGFQIPLREVTHVMRVIRPSPPEATK